MTADLRQRIEQLCDEADAIYRRVVFEFGVDLMGEAVVPVAIVRRALLAEACPVRACENMRCRCWCHDGPGSVTATEGAGYE